MPEIKTTKDLKFEKLSNERRVAREFQERKHEHWNENYQLYRNKVKTNRLTQRQAVNIPLMKETIKTLISRIDDAPNVDWKELAGDEVKEIIYQEIWNDAFRKKKFEWVDVIDKKNVLLYGLAVKKLNITETGVDVTPMDVFDIVFDPLTSPIDIESSRFIIHQNIYRSLREILADERYSKKGKDELRKWALSNDALIQSMNNKEALDAKNERLEAMGLDSGEFDKFSGGDVVVNLTEHYSRFWNASTKKFEKRVIVYAQDDLELLDEKLEDLIGVDFWPFVVWSEDPEVNDIYADSVADLVRVPNKILNVWFSQQVENRTLQNFQMHWYDATIQGYQPQTYEPGPGRMLPAPGDPNKTIMPVQINGLDETFTAIDFLIRIVERGSGATAIEKGVSEKKNITLGEVEMLVGKAAERTVSMQKFYRGSWYELATKWDALMQANKIQKVTLFKKNKDGKIFPKVAYKSDWKSEAGYEPIVSSTSEHEEEQVKGIQKWSYVMSLFPQNGALRKIAAKRALEIVDLTPEEMHEVEDAEKEQQQQQMMMQQQGAPPGGVPPPGQMISPQAQQLMQTMSPQLAQ